MTADVVAAPTPVFTVSSADLTEEELAALTVVIGAMRRERGELKAPENPRIAGGWKSYWHTVRQPLFPGRDAWRATLRR